MMGSIQYYIFTRFIGVILLQITFVVGYAWFSFEKNLQQTLDENFRALTSLSVNIEHFYLHQIDEFKRLAEGKGFRPYDRDVAKEVVENFIRARGLISTVQYYRVDGALEFVAISKHILNYAVEKSVQEHPSLEFREHFNKVVTSREFSITPPLYTRSKASYHAVLTPIIDSDKKLLGVLSFSFFPSFNPLDQSFNGLSIFKENFLSLVDMKGQVIAASNVKSSVVATAVGHAIRTRGLHPDDPYHYVRKEIPKLKYQVQGSSYYLLSKRIKKFPIFAVLGLNEKIFLDKKRELLKFILTITALSSLIGIIASVVISRRVSRGIDTVISSIKELRLGTFRKKNQRLHRDFRDAIHELEDLSIELQKGKLLGNLWGQESLSKHDKKDR